MRLEVSGANCSSLEMLIAGCVDGRLTLDQMSTARPMLGSEVSPALVRYRTDNRALSATIAWMKNLPVSGTR